MRKKINKEFLFFIPQSTRMALYGCFAIMFFITIASVVFYPNLQNVIPIFYSLARTEHQLVDKGWIFLFPILSILIVLINTLLIYLAKNLEIMMLKMFSWATFLIELILLIIFVRLILIVY